MSEFDPFWATSASDAVLRHPQEWLAQFSNPFVLLPLLFIIFNTVSALYFRVLSAEQLPIAQIDS